MFNDDLFVERMFFADNNLKCNDNNRNNDGSIFLLT